MRVRLNGPSLISAKNDGKLWFRHFALSKAHDVTHHDNSLFCDWDCHLHNIITKFVGLPRSSVNVTVQLADGNCEPIERWDRPVTWQNLNIAEADVDRLEQYYRARGLGDYYNENTWGEKVKVYESAAEHEGIKFSWLLKLPSRNQDASPSRGLRSVQCFGKKGLFVDGVHIDNSKLSHEDKYLSWFCRSGQLDFIGEIRPVLSVDRTSITSWPEPIQELSKKLLQQVVSSSIEITKTHFEEEMLSDDDPKALAAWDYLLRHFYICRAEFLDTLTRDERYAGVILGDIAELTQNEKLTLRDFLDMDKICLPRLGYRDLGQTAKLLFLGKCGNADRLSIDDSGLWVKGKGLSPLVIIRDSGHDFGNTEILLRCDDWTGKFLDFDLVTDFWPVIPSRLFERLESDSRQAEKNDASERAIEIHRLGNGISALGEQDSCLVHPRLGLYHEDDHSIFSREKVQKNKVGRFDRASSNHWLYEINGHYIEKNKPRYILFVYISPRELNPEEEASLEEFETSDPEYIQGVRTGWSLLFLGREHVNPIIRPGILPRKDMVGAIREDIWKKLEREEYLFLDGTRLIELRNLS